MFSSYNTWATTQDRLSAIQKQQQKSERISQSTRGKPRQRKPENKGKHRVVKTSKTNTRVISDKADVDITFLTTKNRKGQGRPTNAQRRERGLNEAFKFREDERNRSRNVGQDIADALRPLLQQQQQAPRPAVVIPPPPVVQRDIRQQQQEERAERQERQREIAERQREIARREAIEEEQLRRDDLRFQEQIRLDTRRLDIEEARLIQNDRGIAEINARLDGLDARVRAGQEIAPPQITVNPDIKVEPRIEGLRIEQGAIVINNTNEASRQRGRRTNARRTGGLGHRRREPDTSSSESESSGNDGSPPRASPRGRARARTSRRTPASNLPSVPEARSGEEEAQTLLELAGGLGQRGAEALGGALYNVGAQATSTIGGVVSQGVRRAVDTGYNALPSVESITEAVRGLGRDTPLTQRETIEDLPEEPLTSGGEEAGQVLIRTDEPLARFREGYFVVGQRGSGASDTESSGAESGVLVSPPADSPPKTKVPPPRPVPEPEREPVARPKTMADRVRERLAQQEEERQELIRQEEEERERRRNLREQQARARRKQDIQGQLLESIQDEGARRQLEEAERGGFQARPSPDSLRKLQRPPKGSSDSDSTRRSSESGSEYADVVRRGLESDVSLSGGEGGVFTLSDLEREPTEKRPAPTFKELQEDPFKILDVVQQDPTADVLREAVSDPDSPPSAQPFKRGLVAVARQSDSESETSPDEEAKFRDVKKLSPKQLVKTAEQLQKQQIDSDRRREESIRELEETQKQLEEQRKLVEAVEEIAFLEEADISRKPVKVESDSEISDFLGTSEEERQRRRFPEAQRSSPISTGSLPRAERNRAYRGSSYTSSEGEILGASPYSPEKRKQLQSRRYGTATQSTEEYQSNAVRLADLNRQLAQVESDIKSIGETKKKQGLESKRAVADKLKRDIEKLQTQQEDFLFRGEAPASERYSPLESEVYKYMGRSQGGNRRGSGRPPKSEIPEDERRLRGKISQNIKELQVFNPIREGNITNKGRQNYMDKLLGAMDMEGVNRAMIIYDEIVELKKSLRKLKKED